MKRKHKTYSRPKRPFDKTRIEEEGKIKKDFGLKNKKEIWKSNAKIKSIREKAKRLIKVSSEEQQALFNQLQKIGLKVNSITDVLALDIQDYLERRLQTVVGRKGLAPTIKSARQMITHKKILVDGKVINKPSYIVPIKLEDKITIKEGKKSKILSSSVKEIEQKKKEIKVEAPEREKTPEEEKIEVKISKEVPEQEKADIAEEKKKTEADVREMETEVEGK